eukprot:9725862-Karenia_brevis.AAC.1
MEAKQASQSSGNGGDKANQSAPASQPDAKDATMSDAAHKKCCFAQMSDDKSKSGPQDDQWAILEESESNHDESTHDVQKEDATQAGPKGDPSSQAYDLGNDTWGCEDEDMDDDRHSCPPLEPPSDDDEPSSARPHNPFAAMFCGNV